MSTAAQTPVAAKGGDGEEGKKPPRILRGLPWLVWRQHRVAFAVCLALTAAGCVHMLWQRGSMVGFLDHARATSGVELRGVFELKYPDSFENAMALMSMVPVVAGVFLGAPLIAGDRERGTVQLVTTQSVTRGRWLAVKLGMAVLITVVCSAALSAAFTSWWEPAHDLVNGGVWDADNVFFNTGPVPVALALLHLAVGAALGLFVRRTLLAMGLTLGFALVWDVALSGYAKLAFPSPRVLVNPVEQGQPKLPEGAVSHDNWTVDAHGGLHGFGTCFNERTPADCRAKGIVAERLEYFGYDQMPGIQWTYAAFVLAAAVALLALTLWWGRRRPL
ncbi:ABC transporter permease [Streptomyces rectiverticillatus]|uniref:ABC transporter permease subunit n=1 Tax=Streptomyces rectiverticillatus TaxID=173860 RepID=UPI0015C34172|nr:ABC transporter permease subunit [Streptomyces rectiverticillatus]QLE74830.1 ABC transporter permease [Streptomyces rectiverticillatus]